MEGRIMRGGGDHGEGGGSATVACVLRRDDRAVRGGCFRRETTQEGAGGRAGGIAGEGGANGDWSEFKKK